MQVEASNHYKRRWTKAIVVSVVGKGVMNTSGKLQRDECVNH